MKKFYKSNELDEQITNIPGKGVISLNKNKEEVNKKIQTGCNNEFEQNSTFKKTVYDVALSLKDRRNITPIQFNKINIALARELLDKAGIKKNQY